MKFVAQVLVLYFQKPSVFDENVFTDLPTLKNNLSCRVSGGVPQGPLFSPLFFCFVLTLKCDSSAGIWTYELMRRVFAQVYLLINTNTLMTSW